PSGDAANPIGLLAHQMRHLRQLTNQVSALTPVQKKKAAATHALSRRNSDRRPGAENQYLYDALN
ncbi:MAG: hypothetical protein ACK44A_15520, partial [Roseateles sp.]